MITMEERMFACQAAIECERLVGRVMVAICQRGPTLKARRMAEVLISATLLKKLDMSRQLHNNFGGSLDNILEQLNAMPSGVNDVLDITDLVWPDADDDYINLPQPAAQ